MANTRILTYVVRSIMYEEEDTKYTTPIEATEDNANYDDVQCILTEYMECLIAELQRERVPIKLNHAIVLVYDFKAVLAMTVEDEDEEEVREWFRDYAEHDLEVDNKNAHTEAAMFMIAQGEFEEVTDAT